MENASPASPTFAQWPSLKTTAKTPVQDDSIAEEVETSVESEGAAAALSPSPLRPSPKDERRPAQRETVQRDADQYAADFEEDSQDSFLRLEAEVVQKLETRDGVSQGEGVGGRKREAETETDTEIETETETGNERKHKLETNSPPPRPPRTPPRPRNKGGTSGWTTNHRNSSTAST